MKSLRPILILCSMLCLFVNLNAQCPASTPLSDFSFVSIESFCESDGTITITGKTGGQSPYLHAIIAGPETRPGQNSNQFAALPAGTYTVEVRDLCGTIITKSVTVQGSHTPLTLSVASQIVVCGNDGTICGIPGGGGDTTGGTVTYMYRLIKVDVTPPDTIYHMQSDSCFTGLEEGDYDVQVFDECDNFQTRGHILGRKQFDSRGLVFGNRKISCDSVQMSFYMRSFSSGPTAEPPIDWEIISSTVPGYVGTSGVLNAINDRDTLFYDAVHAGQLPKNEWVIQTTDACGVVKTSRYLFINNGGYFSSGINNCNMVSMYINPSSGGTVFNCPAGSVTYEMTSAPAGYPIPPPSMTVDTFYGAPGTYCFRVIDCCVDTFEFCRTTVSVPDLGAISLTNQRYFACDEGTVHFSFSATGSQGGGDKIVTSAPAGYSNPLPDTVTGLSSIAWRNIYKPPGTYCFEITDKCGRMTDTCLTITDTLIFSYEVEVVPGCINENQVCVTYTSNEDIKFGLSGQSTIVGQPGVGMQVCFVNVPSGNRNFSAVANNGFSLNCLLGQESVVIPAYEPPVILGAWGIECDGGTGLITVDGQLGVEPYTYELFAGPVTRPLQSSPYFPGLPLGTYSVRIFDACNNSYITDVDVEPATLLIRGYDGAGCIGDSIVFYVDSIFGATYSWTGPNGFMNNTSTVTISSADVADAGTYTVNVVLEDESNNLCIDETLSVNVEVFNCICSIQAFDATMVSCFNANNGSATANSTSGAGGPFTYQWSNGGNTQTIGSLPPGTYTVTITDAAGCTVVGDTTITQPAPLTVAMDITDVACFTTSSGEATVTAGGGTPGYTYLWDMAAGGQTTQTAGGLSLGTYAVTVTDQAGCTNFAGAVVRIDACTDCELCEAAIDGTFDICTILINDFSPAIGTLDCDNGGIDNQTECDNGGDPADPADDCQVAIAAGVDICVLIGNDASHPLADQDCDNGGVPNYEECQNGGNPFDPIDDCLIALNADLNICALINYDAGHPFATLDCDGGGVINITECESGEDPSDPADDCVAAAGAGLDICALILGGQFSWGTLDCDNGGVTNAVECANGGDPSNPQDDLACPSDLCEEAMANNLDICAILIADPNHPIGSLDCDDGGVTNAVECANGGDPSDPTDDCSIVFAAGLNLCAIIAGDPNHPFANQDCDGGGVINITECSTGEDPSDPADDCAAAVDAGENICQIINYDPNHPMATLDCDGGGIDNQTECANGGDPADPIDDCAVVVTEGIDLCTLLASEPNNPIGAADCDLDGVTNATECADGTDPLDPCDFVSGSITLPVTADQSGCENLCPDITPITTILPGNIAGASAVGVAVEITELNGIDTDGSTILIRMPSDPRLTFLWDPTLVSVALTPVNNSNWNYLGDNGVVHTFQYVGNSAVITGATTEAFGFESVYDPQNTDGQTTVTASIVPFSGGECNILNDTDSERLVYFE